MSMHKSNENSQFLEAQRHFVMENSSRTFVTYEQGNLFTGTETTRYNIIFQAGAT